MDHMKIRSVMMIYLSIKQLKKNTAILYTPESFTFSEPKLLFSSWV